MAADLRDGSQVLVAPTTGAEFNTIRERLIPVGAWQVDDFLFAFGSSLIVPDATKEFAILAALRAEHPGAPLSLFGHADPTGDDIVNKRLSGRRTMAVYAVLVRRTDLWERLYSHPDGNDEWGEAGLDRMRGALGRARSSDGGRQALFADYMDLLCRDGSGTPYTLATSDFLARGADKDGKGDYQGCGEFNAVLLFSATEAASFQPKQRRGARDAENAPNRRVTALLFQRGTVVQASKWPCPRASEGPEGCHKRFWSDASTRRQFQERRRTQEKDGDTFACRFYERIGSDALRDGQMLHSIQLHDAQCRPAAGAEFTLTWGGSKRSGTADPSGWLSFAGPRVAQTVTIDYHFRPEGGDEEEAYQVVVNLHPADAPAELTYVAHLRNIGFGTDQEEPRDILFRFQAAHGKLQLTGTLNDPTRAAIDEMLRKPLAQTIGAEA